MSFVLDVHLLIHQFDFVDLGYGIKLLYLQLGFIYMLFLLADMILILCMAMHTIQV